MTSCARPDAVLPRGEAFKVFESGGGIVFISSIAALKAGSQMAVL